MDDGSLARLAALTEAAGVTVPLWSPRWRRRGAGPAGVAVVLVEGMSDQSALTTLAVRRGRDLVGEGVFVVPVGGATNIGHFLAGMHRAGAGADQ